MENYSYNSSYPESGDSSPRSREIEFENPQPWEPSETNPQPPTLKVKFMVSYNGKIHPRPNDNQLSYIGGETKILAADRNVRFSTLLSKLITLCDTENISFKYQLPGEDLDALISVTNDDDLEHMMHEYERLCRISPKPARLRLFVFPTLLNSVSSARSFESDNDVKSEKERFVEALNSAPIMSLPNQTASSPVAAVPQGNVDFLFGLEKAKQEEIVMDPIQKHIQDLQRLRLEEQQVQQGIYRRKSDDNITNEYYNKVAAMEKQQQQLPQMQQVHSGGGGGIGYWTDKSPVYPGTDQPVYMVQAPPGPGYHPQMVRPAGGGGGGGYYTVQRFPGEVYRDQQHQQQQIYNMMPPHQQQQSMAAPPVQQKVPVGYSEGYGQMGYDGGMGRQVIYGAPAPVPVQTPVQYQGVVSAGMGGGGGGLNVETGGAKVVVTKVTQASV